jgi:nucleotide-binding universal stress UspA family protein
MRKILMATDLSVRCDRALQRAVSLAGELGPELEIIHVVDEALIEGITRQHEAAAKAAIEQQIGTLPQAKDLTISREVVRGLDCCEFIRRAEEHGFDLIVLGIHRHKTRQMFQGTTAERVVRYGARPVLSRMP